MSKHGAKAARERVSAAGEPVEYVEEPTVYCIVLEKRGGGVVASKGRVPLSAVQVEASHPPDALDFAIGWATSRIEEDMQRGRLK